MKKVTSLTLLTTGEGKRISITYSEIDEGGNLIKENIRESRIIVSEKALSIVAELENYATEIIDGK